MGIWALVAVNLFTTFGTTGDDDDDECFLILHHSFRSSVHTGSTHSGTGQSNTDV